jgi:hypothetical protein
LQQELLSDYANTLREYQARGVADAPEVARKAVVAGMAQNYLSIPGVDDSVQIVRKRDYPAFSKLGKVGPGYAFNQHTGEMENTLDVFRRDVEEVKRIMPGHFGAASNVYVQKGRSDVREDGSFLLMNGDTRTPVMFQPGEQIALSTPDGTFTRNVKGLLGLRSDDGKTLTLSATAEDAERDLQSRAWQGVQAGAHGHGLRAGVPSVLPVPYVRRGRPRGNGGALQA